MSVDDRFTPKEIKAWCKEVIIKKYGADDSCVLVLTDEAMVELMYKAYKRGYQDALSG